MSASEIAHLQQLPTEEKLQLIEAFWESIAPEIEDGRLSDEQAELLDQRLQADLAHPEQAIGLEEVLRRLAVLRKDLDETAAEKASALLNERWQAHLDFPEKDLSLEDFKRRVEQLIAEKRD